MAERIQGINVVIGAETKGLDAALSDVNKKSKSLAAELKNVEKLLKLDPTNAELLAQKQQILTEAIGNTSQKLATLRAAQAQVQQQFDRGDITVEQYRAFQREIQGTEQELRGLQQRLADVNRQGIKVEINGETRQLDEALSQAGQNARSLQNELKQVDRLLQVDPGNLELAAQKQELLTRAIGETESKLNTLRTAQQQVEDQFNRGEISPEQYRRFQRELINTEQELDGLRGELHRLQNPLDEAGDSAESAGEKIKAAGKTMMAAGAGITAGITAPLTGLALAAGKAAKEMADSSHKIEAALGVTEKQADKLAKKGREVWEQGFGEGIGDVNDSLILVKQRMKDLNDADLDKVIKNGYVIQEAFGPELAESTRTISTLMKGFGVDAEYATDIITKGFQEGADFSGEFLDSLNEYTPQFKAMGYSAEEFLSILIKGSQAGAFNLDKVGDAVKEFNIRIKSGAKDVTDTLGVLFAPDDIDEFGAALAKNGKKSAEYLELVKKAGKETADVLTGQLQKGGSAAEKAFTELTNTLSSGQTILDGISDGSIKGKDALEVIIKGLNKITDPAYKAQLGVALLGTQWEDLEADVISATLTSVKGLDGIRGATAAAAEALEKDLGRRWESLQRSAQSALMPIGKIMLDIAEAYIPPIVSGVNEVTTAFNGLSPSTQKSIVLLGGAAAAIGPLVLAAGGAVTAIGFMSTGFTALGITVPTFGAALAALTGPVGLAVAGIAALTVGGVALYDHMQQETIPEIQRFSSVVSESTQAAVGAYMDLNDGVTEQLNLLRWSQETITQETADSIVGKFRQMGDQILAAMEANQVQQYSVLSNFFASSNALSNQQETEALQRILDNNAKQQGYIQEGQRKISAIFQKAAEERRGITEWEKGEINRIQQQMLDQAIQQLTENELEQKAIYERIRLNATTLSARQASDIVKNSIKQRDETIAAAEQQADEVVKAAILQRDEYKTISSDQADKIIKDANRQRDEVVKKAEQMHADVVTEAKQQAKEHIDQIDFETGRILTKWDQFKKDPGWSLRSTGEYAMDGLRSGLESKQPALTKWMGDLAHKMTKSVNDAFGIKSPSRVLMETGKYVAEGLEKGIKDNAKKPEKAAKDMADKTAAAAKKAAEKQQKAAEKAQKAKEKAEKEATKKQNDAFNSAFSSADYKYKAGEIDTSGYISALKKVRDGSAKTTAQIQKVNLAIASATKNQAKEAAAAAKKQFDDSLAFIESKKQANQISAAQELALYEKLQARYKVGTAERTKVDKQVNILRAQLRKADYDSSVAWINKRKEANDLSLTEELAAYERLQERYKAGTDERIAAEKAAAAVRQQINADLTAANQEYLAGVKSINDQLIADEQRLNDAYQSAVDQRTAAITGFKGIFDAIAEESEVAGADLLKNLQDQVDYVGKWAADLQRLTARGIDGGLLDSLRQLGPNAAPEIAALTTLTDEELTKYTELWRKKNEQARGIAVSELGGLREDADKQIQQLRTDAEKRLDELKATFEMKIGEIRTGATNGFSAMKSTLPEIGKQAIQGLIDGMSAMQGGVVEKARAIAQSAAAAMRKALDIHSPSRETRWIGEMVGAGLAAGIGGSVTDVEARAADMASRATAALARINAPAPAMQTGSGVASGVGAAAGGVQISISFPGSITVRSDRDLDIISQRLGSNVVDAMRAAGVVPK